MNFVQFPHYHDECRQGLREEWVLLMVKIKPSTWPDIKALLMSDTTDGTCSTTLNWIKNHQFRPDWYPMAFRGCKRTAMLLRLNWDTRLVRVGESVPSMYAVDIQFTRTG